MNLQHGVTFLSLVYFDLEPGYEIGAIGAAVGAYFLTIIMGYIVGCIFKFLPHKTKYGINVVSLGYWILWVVLMRNFKSSEYKLFLLVFAVIFFLIDLLLDAFEMLLVYFAIRQGESDVSIFQCLARWLSLRGYYNYESLAKQMDENE